MKRCAFLSAVIMFLSFLASTAVALTVDEVLQLKREGVSDETIQLMIRQEMQHEKLADPAERMGVTTVGGPDGRGATVYSTGRSDSRGEYREDCEREKREKAWEMLDNVIIDTRDSGRSDRIEREKRP